MVPTYRTVTMFLPSLELLHLDLSVKTGFSDNYIGSKRSFSSGYFIYSVFHSVLCSIKYYNFPLWCHTSALQWPVYIHIPVLPVYQFSTVNIASSYQISTVNIPVFQTDYVLQTTDHSAAPGCEVQDSRPQDSINSKWHLIIFNGYYCFL
jgi:hypothetical protein